MLFLMLLICLLLHWWMFILNMAKASNNDISAWKSNLCEPEVEAFFCFLLYMMSQRQDILNMVVSGTEAPPTCCSNPLCGYRGRTEGLHQSPAWDQCELCKAAVVKSQIKNTELEMNRTNLKSDSSVSSALPHRHPDGGAVSKWSK